MSLNPRHIVIRADASCTIGGGHVMRCMALALEMKRLGCCVTFAVHEETIDVCNDIGLEAFSIVSLTSAQAKSAEALKAKIPDGCSLIVVDHYGLDAAYEHELRGWASSVFVIDDLANRDHDCDVLLDQTLGRVEKHYRHLVSGECRLLLGPDYALLRPEFAHLRADAMRRRIVTATPQRILVSLGMTDPVNATARVLDAVELSCVVADVEVVLGSSSPHLEEVQAQIESMKAPVRLHVDHPQIWKLMYESDLAIGAAGSTSWERCCLGLPCMMIVSADNQVEIARALEARGAVTLLGRIDDLTVEGVAGCISDTWADVEVLMKMSKNATAVCDGLGVNEVVKVLNENF